MLSCFYLVFKVLQVGIGVIKHLNLTFDVIEVLGVDIYIYQLT